MTKQKAKALFYLLIFILIGWPVVQMYQVYVAKPDQENATVLLHQVSMLQLQMLHSATAEAAGAGSTGALDSLQQEAYTMQFVHQRLELATGKGELAELGALADFLQYVLRLQITGNRALKPEEAQVLERMSEHVGSLQRIYERLITDEGKLSKPVNEELAQADEAMRLYLQEEMLD